jgi:ribosomal-protein-alanine N-acetyltransferase
MGLLTTFLSNRSSYACQGQRTVLRAPQMEDFIAWRDLRLASKAFLQPWEPAWPDDEHLSSAFRRRLTHYAKLAADDLAFPFFIFDADGRRLMGGITISNIRRGVAQMGTLGYWTGEAFANAGVMTDALQAVIGFAREDLNLHRLEAACLPHNTASVRLLERANFSREGFAASYLKINGQWEDHILWGRRLD